MTFKSFTTVNELFDFLLARFNIQPPPNLTPDEHRDWVKLKQHVVQTRYVCKKELQWTVRRLLIQSLQSLQHFQGHDRR